MRNKKATVSEIHLCHRCPRLLAYRLSGKKSAWKVGLKGTGDFPGTLFHKEIAQPFHELMSSGKPGRLKKEMAFLFGQELNNEHIRVQAVIEKHILNPLLEKKGSRLRVGQIEALVKGIGVWSHHISGFMEKIKRGKRGDDYKIGDIFCEPEKKMSHVFSLSGNRTLEVVGAFDSLLLDLPAREAVVIEIKGLKPAHKDEDFIQLALYALLIEKNTGVMPSGVVLYLEEEIPEAVYSARDLKDAEKNIESLLETVADVIVAVKEKKLVRIKGTKDLSLCSDCPFDAVCEGDWGSRERPEKGVTKKSVSAEKGPDEANELMDRLILTLKMLKLGVSPEGYIVGPRLIRLKIRPHIDEGVTVRKIMNRAEDLQIALSLNDPPLMRAQAGYLSVDAPRSVSTPLTLSELLEKGKNHRPDSVATFPLGMAIDGSVEWADLSNPAMTSMLVAGTAGSGKSVFLRSAIIAMAAGTDAGKLVFTVIDPKRVSFTDLTELPHLAKPVIMDAEPAIETLEQHVCEMENRYKIFEKDGVFDIVEYNRRQPEISRHVIVIDEYADLMTDKDTGKRLEAVLQKLCQKGRAAGFHVILSTQRPDSKVVTPLIKANLQLKIALKVTTSANSQVVLDEPGAERLMGNGDMLVGGAVPLVRLQAAIPTKTEIRSALKG